MRQLHLLALLLLAGTALSAQAPATKGCRIEVRLADYEGDSLWIGPWYGRGASRVFGAARDADGAFRIAVDLPIPAGMQAFILRRQPGARTEPYGFWIVDGEREFRLSTSAEDFHGKAVIEGSPENGRYFRYQQQYDLLGQQLADATENFRLLGDEATWAALQRAEQALATYQEQVVNEAPGSPLSRMVDRTRFRTPPPEPGLDWQAASAARYRWQKEHFLDGMDLMSPDMLRVPLHIDLLDFYLLMLPPPEADSAIAQANDLLRRIAPHTALFQWYLPYLVQATEPLSRHGIDRLFVHLVQEHALKTNLPRVSDDQKNRWRTSAERAARVLTGEIAPDLQLFLRDSGSVSLHATKAEWTLLAFWLPDCKVCAKEVPELKRLAERYARRGLRVFSVCGKGGDAASQCWDFVDTKALPSDWVLAWDPGRRSQFATLYNLRSYPVVMLLDRDKRIVYRQIGGAPPGTLELQVAKALSGR